VRKYIIKQLKSTKMKKIMIALILAGMAYSAADAQEVKQVCRKTANNSTSCYKTKYAQNFPICKTDFGYAVCDEPRTYSNSTHSAVPVVMNEGDLQMPPFEARQEAAEAMQPQTPRSQSFPEYNDQETVPYGANYDESIRSSQYCYFGDNVAELNRNPYKGCPAPAYDGTEAAKRRAYYKGN
jgi:hypothetical protein